MCSPGASSSVERPPSAATLAIRTAGVGQDRRMHLDRHDHLRRPRGYAEHLRVPSMSVGHGRAGVGAVDGQQPHTEDEVYVVLRGRARLWTPDLTVDVGPGSVAFVPALEQHRFVDVVEELHVLVVFAPGRAQQRGRPGELLSDEAIALVWLDQPPRRARRPRPWSARGRSADPSPFSTSSRASRTCSVPTCSAPSRTASRNVSSRAFFAVAS